jgi:hypothetical protein
VNNLSPNVLQQYSIRLTNRHLPCVAVGNGKVILPPELCTIAEGQVRAGELAGAVLPVGKDAAPSFSLHLSIPCCAAPLKAH